MYRTTVFSFIRDIEESVFYSNLQEQTSTQMEHIH